MELFEISFIPITWLDLIDISIVSFLFYRLWELVKGTLSARFLGFLFSAFLLWCVVEFFKLTLLRAILNQFWGLGTLTFVVIFAPEIRRILSQFSERFNIQRIFFPLSTPNDLDKLQTLIRTVLPAIQQARQGALIIVAGKDKLNEIVVSGEKLDSALSARLLIGIFHRENPLHDGAVLIQGDKILAAHCILPMNEHLKIPLELGTRHRAAVSFSEKYDALVFIVSEERAEISIAQGAKLLINTSMMEVEQKLQQHITQLNTI